MANSEPEKFIPPKREMVSSTFDADESRMDGPVKEVIQYLEEIHKKYPNAEISIGSSGYDPYYIEFTYQELESEECYRDRIAELKEKFDIRQKEKERVRKKKRAERIRKLENKLNNIENAKAQEQSVREQLAKLKGE